MQDLLLIERVLINATLGGFEFEIFNGFLFRNLFYLQGSFFPFVFPVKTVTLGCI